METKSRYEIIKELEDQKHKCLIELNGMSLEEKKIQNDIEKLKEALKEFQEVKTVRTETLQSMMESIDKSLARLEQSKNKK